MPTIEASHPNKGRVLPWYKCQTPLFPDSYLRCYITSFDHETYVMFTDFPSHVKIPELEKRKELAKHVGSTIVELDEISAVMWRVMLKRGYLRTQGPTEDGDFDYFVMPDKNSGVQLAFPF